MKIEVLGTGCAKCKKTLELINEAVKTMDVDAEVVKVEDIEEIAKRGVMMTPAVLIDGKKKSAGNIPSMDEIKSWLK